MATSVLPTRHLFLLVSTVVCLSFSFSTCKFGRAYGDDQNLGAARVVAEEFLREAEGEGERDDHYNIPHDTEPLFTKALECFNDGYIYSRCDEAYRVSENGEVEVPHEYVDEYCSGPCLKETHLVLDCIHQIFKYFVFYNKATVRDVRITINTGCAYGPKRGDFNVAEHIKVYEDNATKLSTTLVVVYATALIIMIVMF